MPIPTGLEFSDIDGSFRVGAFGSAPCLRQTSANWLVVIVAEEGELVKWVTMYDKPSIIADRTLFLHMDNDR